MPAVSLISLKPRTKLESKVRRDGSRQVRNPFQLVTSEVLYQSGSIDFMHDSLLCGRRFRAFDAVDNFKHETLAIENALNIPAQHVVRVLNRIIANRRYPLKMRMDNIPELISLALAQWAENHGVMLGLIRSASQHRVRLSKSLTGYIRRKY